VTEQANAAAESWLERTAEEQWIQWWMRGACTWSFARDSWLPIDATPSEVEYAGRTLEAVLRDLAHDRLELPPFYDTLVPSARQAVEEVVVCEEWQHRVVHNMLYAGDPVARRVWRSHMQRMMLDRLFGVVVV